MSIRLRLTLLYSGILALTLIAFSATLYAVQSRSTLRTARGNLERKAMRLSTAIAHSIALQEKELGPARQPLPDPDREFRDLRFRDVVRVLRPDGALADHPLNLANDHLPLSDSALAAVLSGKPWIETETIDGERWLVYSTPAKVDGQVAAIVQLARSLAERDRALRALGGTLIAASMLTTGAAFASGWVLSGLALRPIHRVTRTAQAIGIERDFARRVEHDGPNDEVGQLATTFNEMLTRLQEAYQRVERSLKAQRNFVADVSHELRTPLTTLRGNLALLARHPPLPDTERDDVLTDAIDETERLIRLVGDLLALARADAGNAFAAEPVQLAPLVEDICRQVRFLDADREIACRTDPDAVVIADPDALKQVLLILLDNAIKHASDPFAVEVTRAASNDDRIAIRVRDSGPGMPPKVIEHAFDRFYRGDRSRTTTGFGLGLAIARALIEAQGGTLEASSQPGVGSVFTITLPRALTG